MDYQLEDTIYLPFTTRAFSTGIPTALVSGTVEIYEDASVTQITAAETLAVSLDGVVGFNMITVVCTAANGFEAGKSYTAILSVGTVDGVSAVGEVVGHFSIGKSAAYKAQVILDGGVVDSATTTTIVDAALLTQATTDHFVGAQVKITGGTATILGAVRTITGFTPASDTITFSPALAATPQAGDTFQILAGNYGVIEVDANNRVDVGAVAGTAQTAGDLKTLIDTGNTASAAVQVVTDALTSAAAAKLALSAAGIISGTAATGTLSTTVMTSDLTGYVNDELIGRTIIWTGGTADGQASDITDYASASGTVTYTAITTAPANADTFVIV